MSNYSGKVIESRYLLGEMIGKGGMANVYLAKDKINGQTVAVKILKQDFADNEELVRRFKNESKAIALLSHSGIIKVYDLCFSSEIKCIVMEYVNGITLKDYIENKKSLNFQEVCYFTKQILSAMSHAHSKGVVHRDLKPQNVLMTEQGVLKISDFGIARLAQSENRTISDKAIGTVGYVSPEQAKGEPSDARGDLYSIGVMMYEMCTGRLPFIGDSAVSVALKHVNEAPVAPTAINPQIPKGLEEIILKAMSKRPAERYQDAQEMENDIKKIMENPSAKFGYMVRSVNKTIEIVEDDEEEEMPIRKKDKSKGNEKTSEEKKKSTSIIPILTGITGAFVVMTIIFIGFMLYTYNPFEPVANVEVPNMIGMTYDDIKDDNAYSDFDIVVEESEYNAIYGEGVIYEQSPHSGIDVKVGSRIKVNVSLGQKMVAVPDIIGLEETQGYRMLVDNDLSYSKSTIFHDDIPIGGIISAEPGVGSEVLAGSEVHVVVSLGPENAFVEVPDLNNMTKEEAIALLDIMGLNIGGVTYVESDRDEDGTIIAQDPAPNTQAATGSYININVAGEAPETVSVTINVPMPATVNIMSNVSLMRDGAIIHAETFVPSEIGFWSPSVESTGIEQIYVLIDSKLYQIYEVNYLAGTSRLTEDNSSAFV